MSVTILQQTIASLFKRKGAKEIPSRDLELLASMELRWFEPKDARKIMESAIKLGLLNEHGNKLKITFDYNTINIPIAFKPPKDLYEQLNQDNQSLFMQIVNHISISTDIPEKDIIAEINEKQQRANDYLTLETLAILYGKSKDVDVDSFIPVVKSKLFSNS